MAPMVATGEKNSFISMCRNTLRQIRESEILNLAAFAAREGRDGFCNFSMLYGQPYDDLYTDNQDHAVSIYPGSRGRTLSTRNLEAFREGGQRMRRAWRDAPPAVEP